ncbi:hypothetical protein [Actinomadura formosensis]|uniref:hypothetical protein n=1 Tax=Actinomadura formosensis TaxID=60706 RepID=UPI000A91D71A|nr:hypothetical protein [Actinomadura formosensis]
MSEQQPGMPPPGEAERKQVTFAVRIDPAFREQIEGLRNITGQSVNDVGEQALRLWVDTTLADEEVRNKAMAGIEEEERRLQERRAAIVNVLGTTASTPGEEASEGGDTSRGGRQPRNRK